MRRPKATVLYHYFYPDDVVSAVHLSELAQGLRARGWDVTAKPSTRSCREEGVSYPIWEKWEGIRIERVWRPRFRQASSLGRILNASWMIGAWSLAALCPRRAPEVLVIGTDPILSVLVACAWKTLRPRTKIVHWCFDLYPEAAYADELLGRTTMAARILERVLRSAYAACDAIVDIGPCMRRLLAKYGSPARQITLVPWALEEPAAVPDSGNRERKEIFGEARLALMYSGTFGRAHSFEGILELARALRSDDARFAFSVRGNREQELRQAITAEDTNIGFVPFAAPDRLGDRLAAADVHVVSLRPEWTGTVIPSKFFGALAIGRPVIFFGAPDSSIAAWIRQYQVGWVWEPGKTADIAAELRHLAEGETEMRALRERCHRVYYEWFSREVTLDAWNCRLRELAGLEAAQEHQTLTFELS
jgi:colanic acid biosynthesis glycosyl transferase WcaI